MAKLLIVDDELQIRELIKKYAKFGGYEYDEACNGQEAINLVKENSDYDLIVMDIMMPEVDGFSAVKEIRKFSNVPVILLSARSEEYDKLYGFDLGIDDYVTKPFSPKELIMRIGAIINRYSRFVEKEQVVKRTIEYEKLVVNLDEHTVYVKNERVELTLKEYELLVYLLENINTALKRQSILERVWGNIDSMNDRTLDTHVKSLRRKIGEYANNIVSILGLSYLFSKR